MGPSILFGWWTGIRSRSTVRFCASPKKGADLRLPVSLCCVCAPWTCHFTHRCPNLCIGGSPVLCFPPSPHLLPVQDSAMSDGLLCSSRVIPAGGQFGLVLLGLLKQNSGPHTHMCPNLRFGGSPVLPVFKPAHWRESCSALSDDSLVVNAILRRCGQVWYALLVS